MSARPYMCITGNVASDPFFKAGEGDKKSFLSFRVAWSPAMKGPDGGWVDGVPLFVNVKVFGRLADRGAAIVKGQEVSVAGFVGTETYTPKDSGEARTSMFVTAESLGVGLPKLQQPATPAQQPATPVQTDFSYEW